MGKTNPKHKNLHRERTYFPNVIKPLYGFLDSDAINSLRDVVGHFDKAEEFCKELDKKVKDNGKPITISKRLITEILTIRSYFVAQTAILNARFFTTKDAQKKRFNERPTAVPIRFIENLFHSRSKRFRVPFKPNRSEIIIILTRYDLPWAETREHKKDDKND